MLALLIFLLFNPALNLTGEVVTQTQTAQTPVYLILFISLVELL